MSFKFPHRTRCQAGKIKEKPQRSLTSLNHSFALTDLFGENRQGIINVLVEWGRTQRDDAIDAYDSTWRFQPDGSMADDGMRLVIDDARKL